jgi:hypothetical protein
MRKAVVLWILVVEDDERGGAMAVFMSTVALTMTLNTKLHSCMWAYKAGVEVDGRRQALWPRH